MIYVYECESCNEQFEVDLPMSENKRPLSEPCPLCKAEGTVFRIFESQGFQTNMINTKEKKAGGQWESTLQRIHKAAGSQSTIYSDRG